MKYPLHEACKTNAPLAEIRTLIANGANVNARDNHGNIPLHIACANPMSSVVIIDFLIQQGADVHGVDRFKRTSLHLACAETDSISIIQFLLNKHRANVHAMDICRRTPLHYACVNRNLSNSIIELLVKNGADVNCQDIDGRTPLHDACMSSFPSIPGIEALFAFGADVNHLDNRGRMPLHYLYTVRNHGRALQLGAIRLLINHDAAITTVFFRSTLFTIVYTRIMQEKILVGILALKKRIPDDLIGVVMHEVDEMYRIESEE